MPRALIIFISISFVFLISITASARWRFGAPPPDPRLAGKKIVNKLALYNASKYDSRKSGQLITHEKLKREIIEVIRFDILSCCSKECPVQSTAVSQDYTALFSILLKNKEGTSKWDDGVLEYQYAIGISISKAANVLCTISSDNSLVEIINKNQKRADDALNVIFKLQNESYDTTKQDAYDRAVYIFDATNSFKEGILFEALHDSESALDAYEEAIKLNPEFPEAYYQRAEIYRGMSKIKEAVSDYSQAIRFCKNDPSYYIGRGICYYDMDQQQSALKDYKTAAILGSDKARNFLKSKNISWE